MKHFAIAAALSVVAASANAQPAPEAVAPAPSPAVEAPAHFMPASTQLTVAPLEEISSKHVEVGQKVQFSTVGDVVENGSIVIPRGSSVDGTITWKTGRAIGGKSGKFEVTFNTVDVRGAKYRLRGVHRQEGRGNTIAAVFATWIVSGRSAVMIPGQEVQVFTAEQIPY